MILAVLAEGPWASRGALGVAILLASGVLCACGLEAGGVLAGEAAGGSSEASGAPAGSSGSSGSSSAAGSGAGGDAGAGGMGGAGGGQGGMGGAGGGGGVTQAECGDGIVTPPEECDDNNTVGGDRCTEDCACGADNPDIIAFAGQTKGQCYMLFKTSRTWVEIAGYCSDVLAEAAAITTDKERTFVGGHLSQSVWIGGTDFQGFSPQKWEWNNGEPWLIKPCDVSNKDCDNGVDFWVSGEPSGGVEDCLEFKGDTDKFNDNWCFNALPFLCEKAP